MGEINIAEGEKTVLARLDVADLRRMVDKAIDEQRLGDLYYLQLSECGLYVSRQLDAFQRALADLTKAKSSKKWEEANERFRRAGGRLTDAVRQMQQRMEEEEEQGKLFRIDDQIMYPLYVSSNLSVRVRYQWRKSVETDWNYGCITFEHTAEFPTDYSLPRPKRRPSAAKQRENLEIKLRNMWEHMMRLALCSVRDYFCQGGDGAAIPKTFRAKVDPYT